MNTLIISGGSGNDSLVKGIVKMYPEVNLKVLVNAYDNGKSTGVCRKVTNTLGVSDIRKNHYRMYKALYDIPNQNLIEFYEGRYDFTPGDELKEVTQKLVFWGLEYLILYAERFFARPESKNYTYKDFSVSNIIYSQMYSDHGYEETNRFFCQLLKLNDFVILNSFDNVFIQAQTAQGKLIEDEGEIVEFATKDDTITNIVYDNMPENVTTNPAAIQAVKDADLIIISTGTFWASIYPTLQYDDFYRYINESTARKIWILNNEEDKDAYGVTSNQMIHRFQKLGLDLSDFIILQNNDAVESLRQDNPDVNICRFDMGNLKGGKHDPNALATAIYKIYFGIINVEKYKKYIFDFDDTLWARPANNSDIDKFNYLKSVDNLKLLNEVYKKGYNSVIVSGNSYHSISEKISYIYGGDLTDFKVPIWADANAVQIIGRNVVSWIPELLMDTVKIDNVVNILNDKYNISAIKNSDTFTTCVKIKPLSSFEQTLLADYLNDYLLPKEGLDDCVARKTGRTTVDIVSKKNNKTTVMNQFEEDPSTILYVGDEFDGGNDADISRVVANAIHVHDVYETNLLLRLLNEDKK